MKTQPSGACVLNFKGFDKSSGYCMTYYKGRYWRAHRLAYYLKYGPIPKDLMICHKCDVRNCINLRHLYAGTARDNIIDAVVRGRHKVAKLKVADIPEIFRLRKSGVSVADIARKYKVAYSTMQMVFWRKVWRHVKVSPHLFADNKRKRRWRIKKCITPNPQTQIKPRRR